MSLLLIELPGNYGKTSLLSGYLSITYDSYYRFTVLLTNILPLLHFIIFSLTEHITCMVNVR